MVGGPGGSGQPGAAAASAALAGAGPFAASAEGGAEGGAESAAAAALAGADPFAATAEGGAEGGAEPAAVAALAGTDPFAATAEGGAEEILVTRSVARRSPRCCRRDSTSIDSSLRIGTIGLAPAPAAPSWSLSDAPESFHPVSQLAKYWMSNWARR